MNARLLLGGLKSYLPIAESVYHGTGGSTSARYCYSVWLRHLRVAHQHGLDTNPQTLVEIGPGDSIGLGLAALLAGTRRYYALDVLKHANAEGNRQVLDELVTLYQARTPIPDAVAFPRVLPPLADYSFPAEFLTPERLDAGLREEWVATLRADVDGSAVAGGPISYVCPWSADALAPESADMVVSQGVLQDMDHLRGRDDLTANLRAMVSWLKPGGTMSHVIDFSCPGDEPWNHHWAYSDVAWKVVRGKRPYYPNRVPLSEYLALFAASGCDVVTVVPRTDARSVERGKLAARFRDLPDEDLFTSGALIVAVKR